MDSIKFEKGILMNGQHHQSQLFNLPKLLGNFFNLLPWTHRARRLPKLPISSGRTDKLIC